MRFKPDWLSEKMKTFLIGQFPLSWYVARNSRRVAMQHKDEPGPLKFAHLFKNATTVDEILKFLEKTEIATRNWLQNQGRTEEEGVDEGIEEGEE
jgi:hypothetical protein